MGMEPTFQNWSSSDIEQLLLEAADTLTLCPRSRGPKAFGNSMPTPVQIPGNAYSTVQSRYHRLPSADAIARMERCWDWINALPDEDDRRLIYEWSRTKCLRGRSLTGLAAREGLSVRTLRRHVGKVCQSIADSLNKDTQPMLDRHFIPNRPIPKPADTPNQHHGTSWIAPAGKVRIDPELAKTRLLQR